MWKFPGWAGGRLSPARLRLRASGDTSGNTRVERPVALCSTFADFPSWGPACSAGNSMTVELRKLSSGPADRPSLGPTPEGPGGKVKTELEPRVSEDLGRGQRPGPGASIGGTASPFPKGAAQGGDAPARSRLQPWAAVRRGGGPGSRGQRGRPGARGAALFGIRAEAGRREAGAWWTSGLQAQPSPPGVGGGDSGAPRTLGSAACARPHRDPRPGAAGRWPARRP